MTIDEVKEKIDWLRVNLSIHNENYYAKDKPKISDAEYDRLYAELKKLEEAYPQFAKYDSPTQKVGAKAAKSFKKITHPTPMLSLYTETDYTDKGAYDFTRRVSNYLVGNKISEKGERSYCCEPKFDGLAIKAIYKDGLLFSAATRGDGLVGEDVTENFRTISNLPAKLNGGFTGEDFPKYLEVHGEVMMPKSVFKQINAELVSQGLETYVNARNAAAGSLRTLDPEVTRSRKLIFYAYGVGNMKDFSIGTQWDWLARLAYLGIPVAHLQKLVVEPDGLIEYHQWMLKNRETLDYDIDGVVYKVNSIDLQNKMGYSGREPRWAAAHKYAPEVETTTIEGIDIQVGRTGKLTPVARVIPVFVGGTTISNVTLHNQDQIDRLGIAVGDVVNIQRAGDVIPEIVSVMTKGNQPVFKIPHTCPICHSPAVRKEGQVDLRCTGGSICSAQIRQTVIHFVSRIGMNIDGLGEAIVDKLLEADLLDTVADIYCLGLKAKAMKAQVSLLQAYEIMGKSQLLQLSVDTLKTLDKMADTSANNLINAIEKSKQTTLEKFLIALGIRHASEGTAKRLVKHFGTLENIMSAKQEELEAVDDIGPIVSKSVFEYFSDKVNRNTISLLNAFGVKWQESVVKQYEKLPLEGIKIAITGTDLGMSRQDIKSTLEAHGANVVDSVNASTDFLIAGENARSKLENALKHKVPIIDTPEFLYLIKNNANWYTRFIK
jgi:DNA ligase (NAD+)